MADARAPVVDGRSFEDLRRAVLRSAEETVPGWRPTDGDPGAVLVAIYAHYLEFVIARLGEVPGKQLLTFLDRMGVSLLAPGVARTPVVFTLAAQAGESVYIPAGTQVATAQTETAPAVVYETEADLTAVAARLASLFVVDPQRDRYSDLSALADSSERRAFSPFAGERPIVHRVIAGHSTAFAMAQPGVLRLEFTPPPGSSSAADRLVKALVDDVVWEASDAASSWTRIEPKPVKRQDGSVALEFASFPGAARAPFPLRAEGQAPPQAGWLSARLRTPLPAHRAVAGARFSATVERAGLAPDAAQSSGAPVDLTTDFKPFGPTPAPGATFAVASEEAMSKSGGQVVLDVSVKASDGVLAWQVWEQEAEGTKNGAWKKADISDGTKSFTQDGKITVRLSERARALRATIASGAYQRVPLVQGAAVKERNVTFASADAASTADPATVALTPIDPAGPFHPFGAAPRQGAGFYMRFAPGAGELEVAIKLVPLPVLAWEYLRGAAWLSLDASDETDALTRSGQVTFQAPSDAEPGQLGGVAGRWLRARLVSGEYGRAAELVPVDPADPKQGFRQRPGTGALNAPVLVGVELSYEAEVADLLLFKQDGFIARPQPAGAWPVFEPVEEDVPTLYLGFDRALPNAGVSIYLEAAARRLVADLGPRRTLDSGLPGLAWEYWDGRGWRALAVQDGTSAFTASGRVQFAGPPALASLQRFGGDERWWVRVRCISAPARYAPTLDAVRVNAVEAVQAVTAREIVLGSSTAERDQVFRFPQAPVLPDQQVIVLEPERPPAAEMRELEAEEGDDAIEVTDSGQVRVRWHEVRSLYISDARSRHYTIDRIAGTIRFGDGVHGLVPPAGVDNVTCARYRAGGGADGNQAAGAVSQLKTSIPYIAAVTNVSAADGGSPAEDVASVRERGPMTLKNRFRAVSAEDFEWLARQAAGTRVARATALPNRDPDLRFTPGWTTVAIVPASHDRKPLPSPELIGLVEQDLARRSLSTLSCTSARRINVVGPGYVPVELAAAVVPVDVAAAGNTLRDAAHALETFLHPLDGGPDGQGWPMGRDVFLSELYTALERLPSVEHVSSLHFRPTTSVLPLVVGARTPAALADYDAGARVTSADGDVWGRLLDAIPAGAPIAELAVLLFREGERITIGSGNDAVETTIDSISATTLTVDPFRLPQQLATGASVQATLDGHAATTLAQALPADELVSSIVIRSFARGDDVVLSGDERQTVKLAGQAGQGELVLGERLHIPDLHLPYSGVHELTVEGA